MGCGPSKEKRVHNVGFDLLDSDGDNKVSKEEVELVATYLHRFQVNCSAQEHNRLANMNSLDYLYEVVGRNKGDKLKRCDFNKIAYIIPYSKWKGELLPALRRSEIDRLRELNK
tara:strand:+ start:1302 stop:1643 length:342 start_codon:yes stop_codon:yes gene_type:complete